MRKVEVHTFNEGWLESYQEESKVLIEVFNSEIVAIEHIGSTSVKGMKAKPIIDIMITVNDINRMDASNPTMVKKGYQAKGENGINGRRFFQKGGDNRTHHVHIYQLGSREIKCHLAFRDYLRAHAVDAKTYGDLKASLAKRYPNDIESYIKGKEQLVVEIEKRALKWFESEMGSSNLAE